MFSDIVSVGALTTLLALWWRVATWKATVDRNQQLIIGCLRSIVTTIDDEGERRAITEMLAVIRSPARLVYSELRKLMEMHPRPPEHVIGIIRKIAADTTLDEPWKIQAAIALEFTPEQLARAYKVHGPDAITANKIFKMVIDDCREFGTDTVLGWAGLIAEPVEPSKEIT